MQKVLGSKLKVLKREFLQSHYLQGIQIPSPDSTLFLTKPGLAGTEASQEPWFLCCTFLSSEGLPAEHGALAGHCQEHILEHLLGQLFPEAGRSYGG